MSTLFDNYIEKLTPSKRMFAKEVLDTYLKGQAEDVTIIRTPQDVHSLTRFIENESEEHGVVVYAKNNGRVVKTLEVSNGGLSMVTIDIRKVLCEALLCKAAQLFLVHNHPSGSLCPSKEDDNLTRVLSDACKAIGIYLSDHLIITPYGQYYSYKETGRL